MYNLSWRTRHYTFITEYRKDFIEISYSVTYNNLKNLQTKSEISV